MNGYWSSTKIPENLPLSIPIYTFCPWNHGLWSKKPYANVAVSPVPVRIPGQLQLALSIMWELMIRVVMRWNWGLCTDLLAFFLRLRKTLENLSYKTVWWRLCEQSLPQLGSITSKWLNRIAQHLRERERRKSGKDGESSFNSYYNWMYLRTYLLKPIKSFPAMLK